MSGKGALDPRGTLGKDGDEGPALGGVCPDAVWPGLSGVLGGWARLTKSSPDESDSLSDSGILRSLDGTRIDCVIFDSFAGKQVSSNFTS